MGISPPGRRFSEKNETSGIRTRLMSSWIVPSAPATSPSPRGSTKLPSNRPIFIAMHGFLESHGLLHQDAVDQLIEPVFVVVEPDDVVDGAGTRGRVLADALEGDRAEPAVEVGDGPDLALRFGNRVDGGHG